MSEARQEPDLLPDFSLILATYGRERQIERFLESISLQTNITSEVFVIDQNGDESVAPVISKWSRACNLRRVRSAPGLSRARNIGMGLSRGRILAFPDDDCWYPIGLLSDVRKLLEGNPSLNGLTCRCVDPGGRSAAGGDDRSSGIVNRSNVWRRGVSATMFLKRSLVDDVGLFDEQLGLGAESAFQSGEETDYLLRALGSGQRIYYHAQISVFHPPPPLPSDPSALHRSWNYGLGMGRVLRVSRYSLVAVAGHICWPALGALAACLRGEFVLARLRIARALARYAGWGWNPEKSIKTPQWIR